MLVLMRRPRETIVVGDDIEVTVVSINGGQVKLGIQAPDTMRIGRKEFDKDGNSNPVAREPVNAPNTAEREPASGDLDMLCARINATDKALVKLIQSFHLSFPHMQQHMTAIFNDFKAETDEIAQELRRCVEEGVPTNSG